MLPEVTDGIGLLINSRRIGLPQHHVSAPKAPRFSSTTWRAVRLCHRRVPNQLRNRAPAYHLARLCLSYRALRHADCRLSSGRYWATGPADGGPVRHQASTRALRSPNSSGSHELRHRHVVFGRADRAEVPRQIPVYVMRTRIASVKTASRSRVGRLTSCYS